MASKKTFSVREGVRPEPKAPLEEAPQALRYALVKYFEKKHPQHPWVAGEILENFLRLPGLKNSFYNPHDPKTWVRFYGYLESFEWWKVYDFIEAVYAGEGNQYERERFRRTVNDVLSDQNSPWRMNPNGEIVYQGTESFNVTVSSALSSLNDAGLKTAKDEMTKAMEDLSRRPHPDLSGAVHHAMAALECAAADVCGEKGATLGEIVKRHPDKFPPAVAQAVSKLYGFASENGRHITEGGEPKPEEVELVVGIAAVVATYLTRK